MSHDGLQRVELLLHSVYYLEYNFIRLSTQSASALSRQIAQKLSNKLELLKYFLSFYH